MSTTSHRVLQYLLIIALTVVVAGGGYWYWKQAHAAGTVSTNRPSFEAPLTTDLNLTAGQGIATYSRADGADRRATVTDFEGRIIPVKQNEARFDGARRVENLLSYTEDFSNAWWSKFALSTVAGKSDPVGGTAATRFTSTGANGYMQGTFANTTAGRTYRYSLWVRNTGAMPASVLRMVLTTDIGTIASEQYNNSAVGSGWTRYSIVGTTQASATWIKVQFGGGSFFSTGMELDLAFPMFEEVTGQTNQNPSEYVSTNVKTAFPYHGAGVDGVKYFDTQNGNTIASNVVTEATGVAIPSATLRGYLAEGNRTNLLLRSEELDNASWLLTGNNATVSANATVAPGGQSVAEKLVEDTATGRHQIYQNYTLTAADYTVSIYAKAGERTRFEIYIPGTNLKGVGFDLSSVATFATTVAGVSAPTSSSIVSVGNGWYRCQMTWTAVAEATNIRFALNNGTTADSYGGTAGNGLSLWGAQLEQATFASSYIPTTTVSVARNTDNLTFPSSGNMPTNNFVIAYDMMLPAVDTVSFFNGVYSSYDTNNKVQPYYYGAAGGSLQFTKRIAGTYYLASKSGAFVAGTSYRIAGRVSSTSGVDVFVGGSKGTGNANTTNAVIGSTIAIGGNSSIIKNVRLWKKTLSDTELQKMTSVTDAVATSAVKETTLKNTPNDTGLVGYWSFDDGSGTTAEDFSPSGTNTGTLTNGPTWVDGKLGKALSFDGISTYVSLGNPGNSPLNVGTSDFTIASWIKTTDGGGQRCIVSSTGSSRGVRFGLTGGHPYYLIGDGTTYRESSIGSAVVNDGNWHHLVIVFSRTSSTATAYVDGMSSGVDSFSASIGSANSGSTKVIGAMAAGTGLINGTIDDVRIYNRALSQAEITALYGTTKALVNVNQNSQLTSGLVGLWSFNGQDVSGVTAYDRSGSGNNGTLTNGPTVYPGKVGQALSLNGTNSYIVVPTSASLGANFFRGSNWTISMWVNPQLTGNANQELFMGVWHEPRIYLNSPGGFLQFAGFISSVYTTLIPSTANVFSANTWVHVAIVSNGTNYLLYKNGAQVNSSAYQQIDGGATQFRLAADGSGNGAFNGKIDEVRIYNRALSAAEVTALYNLGK